VTQLGRLGQKAGKGWYDYNPTIGKGRKGLPSKEMADFITRYQLPGSQHTTEFTNDQIIERTLYPLVNEGFKILEENIARTPSDIDVIWLYGYGWPAWKGGPMYWADHIVSLPVLLQKLQYFHQQFPDTEHFIPSQLLQRCVQLDMTVEEYYQKGMHHSPNSKM
jgi:3-hydroxyacyl-CoA dehydrogenase